MFRIHQEHIGYESYDIATTQQNMLVQKRVDCSFLAVGGQKFKRNIHMLYNIMKHIKY